MEVFQELLSLVALLDERNHLWHDLSHLRTASPEFWLSKQINNLKWIK